MIEIDDTPTDYPWHFVQAAALSGRLEGLLTSNVHEPTVRLLLLAASDGAVRFYDLVSQGVPEQVAILSVSLESGFSAAVDFAQGVFDVDYEEWRQRQAPPTVRS